MHDLTAQVTSSLLPFPPVTVEALGEDEITLDSVLHGNFTVGRSGLAWLACGPHLEVVHAVTGERLSAYCFGDGGEHAPTILAARDFSWLKRSGLLVGLEEAEGNLLCLYDLGLSRVVKAVVIPGRITAIEPVVSYGGASTLTQHLHQSLRWFFGIAAVVTDVGHVLLVDLCLDDLSCSQSELEASALQVVTKSPAEIPRLREVSTRQGRHLCLQLNAPSGVGATALQFIPRTNQLAVGFSNGNLQMWNMKTLKKEYHSQLEGGAVPVYAFTFQEPENDPRNCCYLWAVQSSQDLEGDTVSLRLLQLAFSERKCLSSGKILYEGLEYCEERYSQELSGTAFPLRAQTTNTRLLSCQTIEKFRAHPDRDDSMNEVASPDTSVSIFSWQVKAYGQAAPSTYVGVFDINRWYHAQMPDSLRVGESLQNCPYLAVWSLDPVVKMVSPNILLDVVVHERSLSRGLPFTCPPPEQYFNPTTYNFDSTCLLNSGIVHLTCSGYQKETLSFLKKAAPCSSEIISSSYSRCLVSGLLSSRLADTQPSSLSQEEQLDAILSTAVETSSLGMITGCIKQWTAEEQPGSALNLRYILDWAWNKVVQTKEELDGICAPLFDSSSNFIDPQTLQLLQHCQRLLGNLSTIFHCLLNEAQELTQKGLVGLINKNLVSSLISKYAQVVLWFCRTGLLPEGSDDDALQISRPCYTHSVISNYYVIRREELTRLAKDKWCADCLMIDGLVGQCGERLTNLWKRDEGGTGQYPPPTLHALLDIYLLDNIDETTKHAIVIYLLLDVMHAFPDKDGASVHSFPSAFAIPVGLVKLVQGLWLLDHHGHQSSFELLLHPAASQCQFEWQHERVLNALMCQGQHAIALRYFHVTKPPISSTSQAKLCMSILLHNRCLVEAWSLVRQHSNRLNMAELLGFLYESCQELGLIKELLKLPLGLSEQECLEKFLQGTGGLQNRELLMVHYLQQANYIPALQLNHSLKMNMVNERDPKLKERANTRNSILDQYGKVLPRVQRKLALERVKPYQHPCTLHREVSRPQPLSAIFKRSANDKVMSRAGFISNVLTKIEEVWLGKGGTPQSSPVNNSRAADIQSQSLRSPPSALPDPFLGTPITMTSKRKSRLMDLVVQPSCQTPQPFLSPPRPPSSWMSPKSLSKAPELGLLQTPQVVKRARALAASGPVFSAFTPQSILRSSLRPTPVATPSASPGRSITPPLRSKESRITFIEDEETPEAEKGPIRWTNGIAADSEISLLTTRGSTLSKATGKSWSSQPAEEEEDVDEAREQPHVKFLPPEGGIPSPDLRGSESESSSIHEVAVKTKPSDPAQAPISLSFDTSQMSVRSTDTTLEFYDAPLSQEQEEEHIDAEDDEEVVTLNIIKTSTENVETLPPATEEPPVLTPEIIERDEEEAQEGEEDLVEAEASKDILEICPEEEAKHEEESEKEPDAVSSRIDEEAADIEQEETPSQVSDQIMEILNSGTEVECADETSDVPEESVLSHVTESEEFPEHLEQSEVTEQTNKPEEEELEQSADLTEFVQQHLFGSDLSPPLTRSGIHDASHAQSSPDGEPFGLVEDKEEEQAAAEPPPVFSSQKSNASVTSSEPTGSDSHSVVSVNDSEESSAESEEEEEEEEDEEEEEEEESDEAEEEEEEDSGSEVEIIEEVQGNGRLPPLQPSSVFLQQEHTHFLPSLTEQETAAFSLITPGEDMKIVDEDIEGDVVMVRLGNDEGEMEVQSSSYMELKPSTTLLVPLELVEGQPDLVDGVHLEPPEIQGAIVPDDPETEAHCRFSLMLDMDEDVDKEVDTLPMENDLQSCPPTQAPVEEASEELVVKHEVILLSADDEDSPPADDVVEEEQRTEMDRVEVNEVDAPTASEGDELQTDRQAEDTETQEREDANAQEECESVMSAEGPDPAGPPPPTLQDLPTLNYIDSEMKTYTADEEDMDSAPAPDEAQEEPEENGPVDTVTYSVPTAETLDYTAEEQLQDNNTAETDKELQDNNTAETGEERKDNNTAETDEELKDNNTAETGEELKDSNTAETDEELKDNNTAETDEELKDNNTAETDEELKDNNTAETDEELKDNNTAETGEKQEDNNTAETEEQVEDIRPLEIEEELVLNNGAAETGVQGQDNRPLETDEELQDIVAVETDDQGEDIRPLETEEQDLDNRAAETDMQFEDNRPNLETAEELQDNVAAETGDQVEDFRPLETEEGLLDNRTVASDDLGEDIRPVETEEQDLDNRAVEREEEPQDSRAVETGMQSEDNRPLETEEGLVVDSGAAETDLQGEDIRPLETEGQDLDNKAVEKEDQGEDIRTSETEEELQDNRTVETEEELNKMEIPKEEKGEKRVRGRPRKVKNIEETPVKQVTSSNSEETTPSSQKKKAPSTPTRRTTRARRTVTFISPLPEEAEEETEMKDVPVTPRRTRTPRKTPVQASPTRRSTREAQSELPKDKEEEEAADNATTTKASSPVRRQVSQTTTTMSNQKTQTDGEEVSRATEPESKEEEHVQEEATQINLSRRTSSRTLTPSKRSSSSSSSSTQGASVRRSRRTLSSSNQVESSTVEVLEEEEEHEEVFAPPVKRSSRKMKTDTQPELLEMEDKMAEEEKKEEKQQQQQQQLSSPARTTRRSRQNSLNMYPQVNLTHVSLPQSVKKTRQGTKTENTAQSRDLPELERNSVSGHSASRRPARSKLWDHPEEELPLLDSPLEVDSETPVADALIKRLQDEEKQEGGVVVSKIVRSSRRSTKSTVDLAHMFVHEPAEDESSPGEHSVIYSPSRRSTRSHRAESTGPTEETVVPTTRSRRRVKEVSPQAPAASEEDHVEEEKTSSGSTSRKTSRQTAKTKGVSEPPAAAEVGLISPLPSPDQPLPRAQRRVKAGEVATSGMNLRRKRIMETVFTKPVTRRKKL